MKFLRHAQPAEGKPVCPRPDSLAELLLLDSIHDVIDEVVKGEFMRLISMRRVMRNGYCS